MTQPTVQQTNGTNAQPYTLLAGASVKAYDISQAHLQGFDMNMVIPGIQPLDQTIPDVNKGVEWQGPSNVTGWFPLPDGYPKRQADNAAGNSVFNGTLVDSINTGYPLAPVATGELMHPRPAGEHGAPVDYGPGTGRTRSNHTSQWYQSTRSFGHDWAERFTGQSGSMAGLSEQGRVVAPGGQIRRFREMSSVIAPPLVNTLGAPQPAQYPAIVPRVTADGGVQWW